MIQKTLNKPKKNTKMKTTMKTKKKKMKKLNTTMKTKKKKMKKLQKRKPVQPYIDPTG